MENHKKEYRTMMVIHNETIPSIVDRLTTISIGLIDPIIDNYDEYNGTIDIIGWRPMTEKELESARISKLNRQANIAKRKQTKEEKEKALLAELKAKYEPVS